MSFVKRNDYDLLDTLLDINHTIFREYTYVQGETTVFTTAFDVYVHRRGVCQDFTNVFICLARLLGVPARYVCGYIYTGPKGAHGANTVAELGRGGGGGGGGKLISINLSPQVSVGLPFIHAHSLLGGSKRHKR